MRAERQGTTGRQLIGRPNEIEDWQTRGPLASDGCFMEPKAMVRCRQQASKKSSLAVSNRRLIDTSGDIGALLAPGSFKNRPSACQDWINMRHMTEVVCGHTREIRRDDASGKGSSLYLRMKETVHHSVASGENEGGSNGAQ